jgi:NADH pyrophosphatase NudC (nudix superfamily)
MSTDFRFCPRCAAPLVTKAHHGRGRAVCEAPGCGFVHWGNPTPVVAAIVEHEGEVLLARGKGWPDKMYGLVTGFLEAGESPEAGVLREVNEELGLEGAVVSLVGVYPFELRNELIVAFHVRATGTVQLGDELEAVKRVPPGKLRAWPFGTGLAVQAWLDRRGAP